jgi:hypothetical protein
MKKRIGDITDDMEPVLWGGAILGVYFLVVKPILSTFGASSDQTNLVNSVALTPPSNNAFSNQFAPYLQWLANTGTTPSAYYPQLQLLYNTANSASALPPLNWTIPNNYNIAIAAESIYSSFGFWHLFGADFTTVIQVFSAFTAQIQVAAVDDYLQVNYGVDLWNFITGHGFSWKGMKNTDLATIVQQVNSLPTGL